MASTEPPTAIPESMVTIKPTQQVQAQVQTQAPNVVYVTNTPRPQPKSVWATTIFTQSNIWAFVYFLIVYLVLYGLIKLLLGEAFSDAAASLFIDCFAIFVVLIFLINFSIDTSTTYNDPLGNFMIWLRNFYDAPANLLFLSLVILFMYLVIFILRIPMGEHKPYSVSILEAIVWVFFVSDAFAIIFMFVFGYSLTDLILNPMIEGWYGTVVGNLVQQPAAVTLPDGTVITAAPMTSVTIPTAQAAGAIQVAPAAGMAPAATPAADRVIPYIVRDASGNIVNNMNDLRNEICLNIANQNATPTPTAAAATNQEVFNVSNNIYTYQQAQDICSAYGARLATYDEVEAAYVDGGEWCNYGWSANQMALFPTQKDTWKTLQLSKEHKNDCGRPGVNGGFIDNTEFQFGANCYGNKPTTGPNVTMAKEVGMDKASCNATTNGIVATPMPIVVNQFNRNKWSEYQRAGASVTTPCP